MFLRFLKNNKKAEPRKLCFKTDLHSHILPGIDDGSPNTEVSLVLIDALHRWGIEKIIATPHIAEETFENTPDTIQTSFGNLSKALTISDKVADITYSAEYRLDGKFKNIMAEKDSLLIMPNNYLLIENSFVQPPFDLKSIIFELQLKDIKPILAHPERYEYYHRKRQMYTELIESGCEFQVNILSLCGYYGEREKETALWLINQGYVSFLGTDLHHFGHVEAISAFLETKEYANIAEKLTPVLKNDTVFQTK